MPKKNNSKYYIDENIVRIIAIEVGILTLLSIINNWIYVILFLSFDFGLRAFTNFPSLLTAIAKITTKSLNLKAKPILANPKKFAAAIGFILTLIIYILIFYNKNAIGYLLGGVLIYFTILESAFKICAGCYLYNWFAIPVLNYINKK